MGRLPPLRHVVDRIFAAPSHLAVLRALRYSRPGLSARAVARGAGLSPQAAADALARLETVGVVRRTGSGRTQLLSINFDHYLVRELVLPIFEKEAGMREAVRKELAARLADKAVSVVVFGSAARGDASPESDFDVLLVVDPGMRETAYEECHAAGDAIRERYGLAVEPVVFTLAKLRSMAAAGKPFVRSVLDEGIDIGRTPLREALK
jgi:predicted nucleotidyltransferase